MHKFLTALVTASLVVAAFIAAPARVKAVAQTYYVGPGADTGGSCTTPDFTTDGVDDDEAIQDAVDAAELNAGVDTIIICDGTYTMTASIAPTLTEGLIIEGETSAALSVIDGDDTYQFIDTDASLTIRNLTLQYFNSVSSGGAIHNDEGDDQLIVEDSVFIGNVSGVDGGAIYWGGDVDVDDSTFEDNTADDYGGALYVGDAAIIESSTFEENFANDLGGAIYSDGDEDLDIIGSDFLANRSWGSGGAVFTNGTVFTSQSTFTANGTTSRGGAIYAYDDASTGYSVFTDNTSGYRGGAIHTENAGPADEGAGYENNHVYNSTFTGNRVYGSVNGDGGAVFAEDECAVESSTFTNNSIDEMTDSAEGGALYCDEDMDLLRDNRFSGNQAVADDGDGYGGAVYADDDLGWSSSSTESSGAFRNTFTNNFASGDGGALYVEDEIEDQFTGNVFKRNTAGEHGGGLYVDEELGDEASFTNNRFEGNIATDGDGGGAYFEGEFLTGSEFKGNRFSRNRAGDLGGALRIEFDSSADPLNLSRNTFVLNRAAIGGAVGAGEVASRGDARVVERALRGNRLVNNKATQQRRTFNVGIELATLF